VPSQKKAGPPCPIRRWDGPRGHRATKPTDTHRFPATAGPDSAGDTGSSGPAPHRCGRSGHGIRCARQRRVVHARAAIAMRSRISSCGRSVPARSLAWGSPLGGRDHPSRRKRRARIAGPRNDGVLRQPGRARRAGAWVDCGGGTTSPSMSRPQAASAACGDDRCGGPCRKASTSVASASHLLMRSFPEKRLTG
jgi:hypothetical protein